jgi:nitroreductase
VFGLGYPNDVVRMLYERSSCRDFLDREVSEDVLRWVLGAGIHAASAGNLQPFSIVRVEDSSMKYRLAEKCKQTFIGDAPVLLIFCLDFHRNERWAKLLDAPYSAVDSYRHFWVGFQDVMICAQSVCTAADAVGLGSVYIGTICDFPADIQAMCGLPNGVFPVVLVCLGYPSSRPLPRKKLSLDVVVHRDRYRELSDEELLKAYDGKYKDENLAITEERIAAVVDVCRKVHGEEFAKKCEERMRKDGFVNRAQHYFGLHYRADTMPEGNVKFWSLMEKSGFGWLKKFEPAKAGKH